MDDEIEYIYLNDFVEDEISKQNLNLKLDQDLLTWLSNFDEVFIESNGDDYRYNSFVEQNVYDKKYYKIDLRENEAFALDEWTYILLDFQNKVIVQYECGRLGESVRRYWDSHFNELVLRDPYPLDFNTDSVIKLLMQGISYENACRIVELHKQGITLTKENIIEHIDVDEFRDGSYMLELCKKQRGC